MVSVHKEHVSTRSHAGFGAELSSLKIRSSDKLPCIPDVSLASFLGLLGGSYNAHPTNADAIMNAIGTRMPQPGSV
jgi:hypothetical protein